MKFNVNQKVVHLSHGLGTITGIEKRSFSPEKISEFYILTVLDGGAPKKVFVPVEQANGKLRAVCSKETAQQAVSLIVNKNMEVSIDAQTWNRRYREYMELIHSGQILEVAKVYVSLRQLKDNQDLSFGERKLLEHAKALLVRELECTGIPMPSELTE